MLFTIQTITDASFTLEEIGELEAKCPSLKLVKEENKKAGGWYYIFQDIDTIGELNDLVADFGCPIVYGDTWEANGTYYPVIEIYDQMRE